MNKKIKVVFVVLLLVLTLFVPIMTINTKAETIQNDMSYYDFNIITGWYGNDYPNADEVDYNVINTIDKTSGTWNVSLTTPNIKVSEGVLKMLITFNKPFLITEQTSISFDFTNWSGLSFNFNNAVVYLGTNFDITEYYSLNEIKLYLGRNYHNQLENTSNLNGDTWSLNNNNFGVNNFTQIYIAITSSENDSNNLKLNYVSSIKDNSYYTSINNNTALQYQINLLREQINELNNTINSLNATNTNLMNEKQALQTQINSLQNTINYLQEQINNSGGYRFDNLFWSIASVPFGVLISTFNVDLLGFNLSGLITGTLTALLLIWLIKKFLGR